MVGNICCWAVVACIGVLLSACGGGDNGGEVDSAAAPGVIQAPAAATVPQDVHASVSFQVSEQRVSMHGGGAYLVTEAARKRIATRVLESGQSDPGMADDAAREQMAVRDLEFEQSFSIEMNRQHAEGRALDQAAELMVQAYVPHEE